MVRFNRLQEGLQSRWLGRIVLVSKKVPSTNEWARQLAAQGAEAGTIALSETQTKGRGRFDRLWISPPGGLWFSIILRPDLELAEASKLTFTAGLAVAETLHEQYDLNAETKWPNDVLVNGRKVCGILGETISAGEKVEFAVLGIGLNVNFDADKVFPKSIRRNATSLETELERKVDLEQLFKALIKNLEFDLDLFKDQGFLPILSKWKKHASFLGMEIRLKDQEQEYDAVAHDVDTEGALIVKFRNGTLKRVFTGDLVLQTIEHSRKSRRKE